MTLGGHTTTWEEAFPTTLKSLKESKSSMNTLPSYDNAFVLESQQLQSNWGSDNPGQQTDTFADPSNVNAAASGSTSNLNDLLALDSVVQPVVPDNPYRHTPNVRASNAPLFAMINIPELTDHEAEGGTAGV